MTHTPSCVAAARRDAASHADLARVARIEASGVLRSGPGPELDELARRAAELMGTRVGAVTAVLRDSQEMLAASGMDPIVVMREQSFCTHVVASGRRLVVPDAIRDPSFAMHPMVDVEGPVRTYCGYPITTNDGFVMGALCVIDPEPRPYSSTQLTGLAQLAGQARALLFPGAGLQSAEALLLGDADDALEAWMSSDPLAAWIARRAPVDEELIAARRA